MARRIESRLKINLTLRARTPLHVGGMGSSVDTDLALAVNGQGDYYIPGTSLAGAFRGWLETGADQELMTKIRALWGYQKPKRDSGRKNGERFRKATDTRDKRNDEHASFVLIDDALIRPPEGRQIVFPEIRDGVGIDRVTGAAARQIKFDSAILPRGTLVSLGMLVEFKADSLDPENPEGNTSEPEERDIGRILTQHLLEALRKGEIRLGASKSRGLGRVELVTQEVVEQQLATREGMLATLRGQGALPRLATNNAVTVPRSQRVSIEVNWIPRGPLMVKAEREGIAVDMLPLVSSIDELVTFVLPGSSLKGAFRSQAERIVRTVLGINAPKIVEHKQDFIDQVETKRGDEDASLIGWLFGIAGKVEKKDEENEMEGDNDGHRRDNPLPGFSAVMIDDCYASLKFDSMQWLEVEQSKNETELREKLNAAGLPRAQQSFHVAIDRWLGSAADGFLYSVLEPHGIEWEPIHLNLDLGRLPNEAIQKRAVMLLLLTLRDFVAGRIPLGFGANRGMGAVEVTGITITPHDPTGELGQLQSVKVQDGKLQLEDAVLRAALNESWQRWCNPQPGGASE